MHYYAVIVCTCKTVGTREMQSAMHRPFCFVWNNMHVISTYTYVSVLKH